MISIIKGKIYVEGVETIDPELIGFAFIDMIETCLRSHQENMNITVSLLITHPDPVRQIIDTAIEQAKNNLSQLEDSRSKYCADDN